MATALMQRVQQRCQQDRHSKMCEDATEKPRARQDYRAWEVVCDPGAAKGTGGYKERRGMLREHGGA